MWKKIALGMEEGAGKGGQTFFQSRAKALFDGFKSVSHVVM